MKFSMSRAVFANKQFKLRYSDHFTLILKFSNLPEANRKRSSVSRWNLCKEGGWESYKKYTNDDLGNVVEAINDDALDMEVIINRFEKMHTKAKFKSFGKITVNNDLKKSKKRDTENENDDEQKEYAKEIVEKQSKQLETEINNLKEESNTRSTRVFKLIERIQGPKKPTQVAHAIMRKETKEILTNPEEIMKECLTYCLEVPTNNIVHDDFKQEANITSIAHEKRMVEKAVGQVEFKKADFDKVVENFSWSKKRTYDFLVKAGDSFKECVFYLCKRILETEEIPSSFDYTDLHQIYKGKGPRELLENSRFIHSKPWLPRTVESMVVLKMKPMLLKKMTKFQIGGAPGHRSSEHIFSAKSMIQYNEMLGNATLMQTYDIRKFFDKEVLKDAMDEIHNAGVDPKVYKNVV